jgi:hypothetical protein
MAKAGSRRKLIKLKLRNRFRRGIKASWIRKFELFKRWKQGIITRLFINKSKSKLEPL